MKRILSLCLLTVLAFTSCKKESVECIKVVGIHATYLQICCNQPPKSYIIQYEDGTSIDVSTTDVEKYKVGDCK